MRPTFAVAVVLVLAALLTSPIEGSPLYFLPSQEAVRISTMRDWLMRESIQRRHPRSVQEEDEADPDEPVEDLVLDYVLAEPKLIGPLDEKTTFEKYMRGTNAPYMRSVQVAEPESKLPTVLRFGKRSDPGTAELNELVHDLIDNVKYDPTFAAHKHRYGYKRSLARMMKPNFLLVPLDF